MNMGNKGIFYRGRAYILIFIILLSMVSFAGCDPMESEMMQNDTFVELLKVFGYKPIEEPAQPAWILPCKYIRISSPFGYRDHPVTNEWKLHTGIDLSADMGTEIVASRAGKVIFVGENEISGKFITIDHGNGYRSQYLHMKEFAVEEGQYVAQGERIGYVGDTGRVTGPHLHFTIRKYDDENKKWEPVDPTLYLEFPSQNK